MLLSSLFLLALNFQLVIRGEHIRKRTNKDVLEILLDLYELNHDTYQRFFSREELKLLTEEQDLQSKGTKDEKYDFIIVGSGSAGSVLANRLSEISKWDILVLEAGRLENALSVVPYAAPILQFTDYNWQNLMEYQEGFAQGLDKHRLPWHTGKALGGSSVINYMIYSRGHPKDYDRWAAKGNPGWAYNDVLKYFVKSENSSLACAKTIYHGTKGEWRVEDVYQDELVKAFVRGGEQLGYKHVDYTSSTQAGFSTIQANTMSGKRHSTAAAFLQPITDRSNLHIKTSAYVTRVLIDPETKQADGVEYVLDGKNLHAHATKEVILSAGTIRSAHLLMLSGIGPQEHLHEFGIDTLLDLPVGKYLQDHLVYVGLTFTVNATTLNIKSLLTTENIKKWLENGHGPLTTLAGIQGLGSIRALSKSTNYTDVQLLFSGCSLNSDYGMMIRKAMSIRDDVYYPVWEQLHGEDAFTIMPMLLRPKSVGHLKLQSKSPFDDPLLYGNYLTDPQNKDLRTLIRGIRFAIKLTNTPAFKEYSVLLHPAPIPGCEHHKFNSDKYWECCIRTLTLSFYHQVGTCRMGPNDDPTAVVDSFLKVYGTGNLRVVDCSVIPFAITAHTAAPAVMIGEKAADIIKHTWNVIAASHK